LHSPPYRTLALALALCLVVVARYWWWSRPKSWSPAEPLPPGLHRVVRVIDGDTLVVDDHTVVRLIGVDAPETQPEEEAERLGPEATAFTERFLSTGTVRLTFDRERVDRFGRFLAYVWVGNRLLNEDLLRAGLARFEPQYHYSAEMKQRFREAQQHAEDAGVGIWSEDPDSASWRPARIGSLALAA
jgi:micrococcal nuclease